MKETTIEGIKVYYHENSSPIADARFLVKTGSLDEHPTIEGAAHYLEHLAFKGTTRRSYKDIADETADIGANSNASTSQEVTGYYMTCPREELDHAVDMLADNLCNSLFSEQEIEKERSVILSELKKYKDDPMSDFFEQVATQLYPADRWYSHPIIGTRETVEAMSREQIMEFFNSYYTKDNIVFSVVGSNLNEEVIGNLLKGRLSNLQAEKKISKKDEIEAKFNSDELVYKQKDREQTLIYWAMPSVASYCTNKLDAIAQTVLINLLAGDMYSILFQEVREERGLCYSIGMSRWGETAGYPMIDMSTEVDPKDVEETEKVVKDIFQRLSTEKVDEKLLSRAKMHLISHTLMAVETSSGYNRMHSSKLFNIPSVEEKCQLIKTITTDDILRIASAQFQQPIKRAVMVGE